MPPIEVLIKIGERKIVVPLTNDLRESALREQFTLYCSEDELLKHKVVEYYPIFQLYYKKFDEIVELKKDHEFQDGQCVVAHWEKISEFQVQDTTPSDGENIITSDIQKEIVEQRTETVPNLSNTESMESIGGLPDRRNQDYDVILESGKEIVEGGISTTQIMKDPDSLYAAVTYSLDSYDAYSSAHLEAIDTLKCKVEAEVKDKEMVAVLAFIAAHLDCKIVVFQVSGKTLVINPIGTGHARIVYNLFGDHYDCCIDFTANTEPIIEATEDEYLDIKPYFKENQWSEFTSMEKERFRNLKTRYEYMLSNNMPIKMPYFMEPPTSSESRKKKPLEKPPKQPKVATRMSERIMENGIQPAKEVDLDDSDKENTPPAKRHLGDDDDKENTPPAKRQKVDNVLGQFIPYPCSLPIFSEAAIVQLQKPASAKRKMRIINEECRVFIFKILHHLYPSKLMYNNFCRTLVEKYPNMKDQNPSSTNIFWGVFKMSLRSSFRGKRSYLKNVKGKTVQKKGQPQEEENDDSDEPNGSDIYKEQEPLDQKLQEIGHGNNRKEIQTLIRATIEIRKMVRESLTPRDILERYPHLKTPEMMICDYLLLEDLEMDILISNFNECCTLLSRHFKTSNEPELANAEVLMGLHDHFLSRSVKKKIHPILILKDEREGAQFLTSSKIQAPFVVILVKQDFCTGVKEIRSASLMMEDRLINSLQKPSADQIAILLLASYYTLNVEYPKVYEDFMKALERIVMNENDTTVNRSRKAGWNKFLSMLKP